MTTSPSQIRAGKTITKLHSSTTSTGTNQSISSSPPLNKPIRRRRDSKVSISTKSSVRSRQEYLDGLAMPTQEEIGRIALVQEKKETENIKKRLSLDNADMSSEERQRAAELIQRSYRGHRERRMLAGMSLDPTTRWVEAVKEARYRHYTQPRAREGGSGSTPRQSVESAGTFSLDGGKSTTTARQNWKKIGVITRRAGGDEDSDDSDDEADDIPHEEKEARRRRRMEEKLARQKAAKVMDLQYFLEMVDLKHRYGNNLRTYHEQWKKSDTKENFFYWLDYGDGRLVECAACPRARLDHEQVRYLSKEERLNYLVRIDSEGRLCWVKNGVRIDTTENFKDSIHGIVPDTDDTPAYAAPGAEAAPGLQEDQSSSDSSSEDGDHASDSESARANKYATPDFDKAKGVKKVKQVSAATIFNKLLRGTVKKNTWIFVADTNFRLFVGIKQSGAFQHSSFLHGSRISAAGLIKIKNGRLSKLSPLSGHYRPPVSNFRAFVHSLNDAGVDMGHVSISHSYAILAGLEAYAKAQKRGMKMVNKFMHHKDKMLAPQEFAKREEEMGDKTESATREKRFREWKEKAEENEKDAANRRLLEKLKIRRREATKVERETDRGLEIQAPGTGPENAIPPEGTREA